MSEFFSAGGFGMYPVSAFGSALCALVILDALRGRSRPVTVVLGVLTLCSGTAGTCTGVAGALRLPAAQSAAAIGDSLHVVVLALVLVMIACVAWMIGRALGRPAELADPALR